MARYQRDQFVHGYTYHIYNVVVGSTLLFAEVTDYQNFITKYKKYLAPYFDTYAYCLIPNHFHIVVKVKNEFFENILKEDTNASRNYLSNKIDENRFLENQLSRMFSSISLSYNKKYHRSGPLFKQGTKRVIVKTQERLIDQICYTHRNCIHHGLVNEYSDWRFHSYTSYLSEKRSLINRNEILGIFGGREQFILIHENYRMGNSSCYFD